MSYLRQLLAAARARVADAKQKVTADALEQRLAAVEAPRGFERALRARDLSVIAEIKRASPAKGALDLDLDAAQLARAYAAGGAAAVSVLTEPSLFRGSIDDLVAARGAGLPVLRKDFVIDPYQLMESRAVGADAVLLIARVLGDELAPLVEAARALRLDALVEVYDEAEVDAAVGAGASVVGVNHRDLESFEVDAERTAKLAALVPEDVLLVALSGVSTRAEIEELAAAGARAVLVGESLVTAGDPAAKLRELLGTA